jgi:hypothetical protein
MIYDCGTRKAEGTKCIALAIVIFWPGIYIATRKSRTASLLKDKEMVEVSK